MSESRFSLNDKEQILADNRAKIQRHDVQADCDRRNIRELSGIIESERGEINRALAGDEQLRRDQHIRHNCKKKAAKIATSEMLNQCAMDTPTLPINLCLSHLIQFLVECSAVLWECWVAEKGRQAFWTHMENRETFFQIQIRPLQHLLCRNWICVVLEYQNRFTQQRRRTMRIKHQFKIRDASLDRQPKIQSSSVEETLQRFAKQTNNDCRFSDLHFDKFPTPATFACWNVRFKNKVCTCHGSFALDQRGGDGWFSGWFKFFVVCKRNSNAEFWSTRWEDCFNTEQKHPQFSLQKKGQSGGTKSPKRGPFPSWQADCFLDPRVLPGHKSQQFCRELCRPIHYWSSKWRYSGIRFEVGRNSIIKEGLYRLRIRESEKLKTVLEL